jgi:hypothetical protein
MGAKVFCGAFFQKSALFFSGIIASLGNAASFRIPNLPAFVRTVMNVAAPKAQQSDCSALRATPRNCSIYHSV